MKYTVVILAILTDISALQLWRWDERYFFAAQAVTILLWVYAVKLFNTNKYLNVLLSVWVAMSINFVLKEVFHKYETIPDWIKLSFDPTVRYHTDWLFFAGGLLVGLWQLKKANHVL